MKKTFLLLVILPFFSFELMAADPVLTIKDLSTSPQIAATTMNLAAGTRKMINNALFTAPTNYTVEVKAKILSAAVKGFFLETRNSGRTGMRMSINSSGIDNYGALNYTNETAATNISSAANDAATYHTFRFAVEGTNVHIYRDGVFVTTTTTQSIYSDNLLKDNNGNFESADMTMWNFILAGQGRTTTAGEFRTGAGALKLINSNTTSVVTTLTIKGLKPSTAYSFSFYAKYLSKTLNNGNMRYDFKLGNYDGTGTFVKTNASDGMNNIYGNPGSTVPASAVWTLNGKTFTTGVADSVAILDVIGWNGSNTYVIDDMVLSEMEATPTIGSAVGPNLVTNGDFATDATGWSAGGWPLGAVVWSSTNGGQLQIKEGTWVASNNGAYSVSATVSPNKTYKLSATTSQRAALGQSIKLVDGAASVKADYTSTGLSNYSTNTTPALTTSPTTTSLSMQFSTKTNSSTGTPVVVMTLDDVVLQEYAATYPTYLSYGKAFQSEASNFDIAYINYDVTGAYAPQNYVISASSSGNGSVSGAATYTAGASVSLTATANSGYRFVNWTLNTSGGAVQSTDATYAFTASAAKTLVANFAVTTVSVTQTTRTGFAYTYSSGPSSEQSFIVGGTNLNGNISISPLTNYEISTSTGGSFSATNPITLTPSNGSVSETNIYVRLKAGLAVANYNSENITIATTGISDQNVACSGSVNPATPTVIVTPIGTYTYNGTPQGPIAATKGGSAGTLTFSYSGTGYGPTDVAPTNAGSYTVTATVAANGNYNSASSSATAFTIDKVALTITAGNQSVAYGTAAATVTGAGTYTPSGFVNSEGAGVISGSVSYSTNYSNTTVAETTGLTITPNVSGLSATNYSFNPVAGTITIAAINTVNVPAATAQNLGDLPVDAGTNLTIANNGTLTVNTSPKVNSVTVDAGGKLNVNSQITVETVTLKAGKDATTFSAKIDAKITATTVRLLKTIDDTKWYFMAFPCNVSVAAITKSDGNSLGTLGEDGDWFIKYYDGQKRAKFGTGSNWKHIALQLPDPNILLANKGYIIGLKTLVSGTYNVELSIPLTPNVLDAETDGRTVPVTAYTGDAAGNNYGWNLIGLPYLSNFNGNGAKTSATHMSFIDGNNITYTDVSNAESYTIPPMSAYFVQVGSGTTISFNYLGRQGAKTTVDTDLSDKIQINFASSTGIDKTNLIMDNNQSTAYEIGQDYEKMIGIGTDKPQVYTMLGGVNYSYNALPITNVVNLPIGFYTKTAGSTTISVDATQAPSLSKLLLTDNGTSPATITNLLTSNYTFTAVAGTNNSRFAITAQRIPTANVVELETESAAPQLSIVNGKLSIQNLDVKANIRVFDAIGRMVINKKANSNTLEINLSSKGIYNVQIEAGAKNWVKKIVN